MVGGVGKTEDYIRFFRVRFGRVYSIFVCILLIRISLFGFIWEYWEFEFLVG